MTRPVAAASTRPTSPSNLTRAALLLTCGMLCAADQGTSTAVRYENVARTFDLVFSRGSGISGEILPLRPSLEQQRRVIERLGDGLFDCSDVDYRCLTHSHAVFAVPRKPLENGMRYVAGGARLTVEKCLRATGSSCQVALISAECQSMLKSGRCQLLDGSRDADALPGPVAYFIYNEDYGVTAFGSGSKRIEAKSERIDIALHVATQLVLQGEEGLLKATLETATANH